MELSMVFAVLSLLFKATTVYFAAVAAVFLLFYAGLAWNFSRWAGQGEKRPMAAFSLICEAFGF